MNIAFEGGLAGVILAVHAVNSGAAATSAPAGLPAAPSGQEWKLVWSDEFDGAQVDTNKWDVMGDGKRRDGWWVKEDAFLDGKGNLVLRTK